MTLVENLEADVSAAISTAWDIKDGRTVPLTGDVKLAGGGVRLEAATFYADLADSTELVVQQDRRIAAKVFKAFLACATRLIKARDGYVRSFDGDRVMGVFLGERKRSNAVQCAMNLKWAFDEIIRPQLLARYAKLESGAFKLNHSAGIDVGDILVVRGGVRADNDLLWVGEPANVAAKLSAIRDIPYRTFITKGVYSKLSARCRYKDSSKSPQIDMWEKFTWAEIPSSSTFYKSSFRWKP